MIRQIKYFQAVVRNNSFSEAAEEFSAKYPDVQVKIAYGNHEELYELLRTGGVDLVLNDQRRAFSYKFFLCMSRESQIDCTVRIFYNTCRRKTAEEERQMDREVMILTGAGQIGMAIARRMGYGKKIVIGDKKQENAEAMAGILNGAGFDVRPMVMDLSSRDSIRNLIAEAQKEGEITMLVNAAGVSPSQAPVEAILKVDLYGTAVLLEEVGKIIAPGGTALSGHTAAGKHP